MQDIPNFVPLFKMCFVTANDHCGALGMVQNLNNGEKLIQE